MKNYLEGKYEKDMIGNGIDSLQKVIQPHRNQGSTIMKKILIGISVLFLFVMIVFPMCVVLYHVLKNTWEAYCRAVFDEYTIKAFWLTVFAAALALAVNTVFGIFASILLSKFYFRGRQVLAALIDIPLSVSPVVAGLLLVLTYGNIGWMNGFLKNHNIKIVFAVPGVVLATIFVTFPLVFRELFPVMNAQGKDEEEAAALMGANAFMIFRKITFPKIKWPLLYGMVLCTARAMGEFGAVSVISGHIRGKTNTLPLQVEILYNEFHTAEAFAVASILVVMSVGILIVRNVIEIKRKR